MSPHCVAVVNILQLTIDKCDSYTADKDTVTMANRSKRAILAHKTVAILEAGHYTDFDGESHDISNDVEHAKTNTRLYSPAQFLELVQHHSPEAAYKAKLEVTGEGAVGAARRLAELYSNVTPNHHCYYCKGRDSYLIG